MYKQQSLIVSLDFRKMINLFFKSDWLIAMLFQGQQRCLSRNMSHLVKSGSAHSLLSSSGMILILGWTIPLRKPLFECACDAQKFSSLGFETQAEKEHRVLCFRVSDIWPQWGLLSAPLPCCILSQACHRLTNDSMLQIVEVLCMAAGNLARLQPPSGERWSLHIFSNQTPPSLILISVHMDKEKWVFGDGKNVLKPSLVQQPMTFSCGPWNWPPT